MIKKIIYVFLIIIMTLFAFGCNKKDKKDAPTYDYTVQDKTKQDSMFNEEELFKIVPQTEFIADNFSTKGYILTGLPYNGGQQSEAFFWLGKPTTPMPKNGYPAVILVHGGGGNAYSEWVDFWTAKGYVALAIDIGGQMYDENVNLKKNPNFLCNGSWGSVGCGTDETSFKQSWTYVNVCNIILAHNYLRSLDFVNPNKTVITGISWGAFITCIVSGIDKRFQAFAPVYGCSLDGDSWGLNTAGLIGLSEQKRKEWANVYDPVSYLPYCTKPIMFVSGMTDHAFSPISHKNSTSVIAGKVFYAYSSSLPHGHYWNQTPAVELFFNHILNGTKPIINFLSATCDESSITFELESEPENGTVYLSYTTSTDEDSHNWQWQNEEVTAQKGVNTISLPDETVAVTIIGYSDEYSYPVASTDVFFPSGKDGKI